VRLANTEREKEKKRKGRRGWMEEEKYVSNTV
jgi:hypothetical protein